MILDSIDNLKQYNFAEDIIEALKIAAEISANDYKTYRIDLENGNFILPNEYQTNVRDTYVFEAHKKYIDVMYMVEGEEVIMVKCTDDLTNITSEYNSEGDYILAEEDGHMSKILLKSGSFVILYPADAHCPACAATNKSTTVKKIIGKVKVK